VKAASGMRCSIRWPDCARRGTSRHCGLEIVMLVVGDPIGAVVYRSVLSSGCC